MGARLRSEQLSWEPKNEINKIKKISCFRLLLPLGQHDPLSGDFDQNMSLFGDLDFC